MQIRIRYCRPCRYRMRAEHLAELLRQEFDAEVVLEVGTFGVFKVWIDGEPVFDKYRSNGWPGRLGFGKPPPPETLLNHIRVFLHQRTRGAP